MGMGGNTVSERHRKRTWFDFFAPAVAVVVGSVLIGLGVAYDLGWLWVS